MFSPMETKVLKTLGKKKMMIMEIAGQVFEGQKRIPLNPNNSISGAVIQINKKCKYHRLDWFINGTGLGRGGKSIWKDKT